MQLTSYFPFTVHGTIPGPTPDPRNFPLQRSLAREKAGVGRQSRKASHLPPKLYRNAIGELLQPGVVLAFLQVPLS